ncbi:MAG: phosphate ABC transporter permease subunit PstC [Methanophagales archaeon ANME-1-THS]|nr:MAG: phosphate ABC transporter permease subunit PstC [Methanophagales archaeon ANME-1-THS]
MNLKLTRKLKEVIASRLMLLITALSSMLIFVMILGLFLKARLILATQSLPELLLSTSWHPLRGEFGFYPFILGTIWVTVLAMFFSIPSCLLTSIYLTEYASAKIRAFIKPLIDLLAGIPSVVYGLWGILVVVPLVKDHIAPLFGYPTSGYCLLTGGFVLAIMVFPVLISVSEEVFRAVPHEVREISLALGATRWQTVKHAQMVPRIKGIIAAIVLGFSRAFGETMAVMMVVGNVAQVPSSVFQPAYPLPALIANNYGEMMSIPLYDAALLLAALLLLLIVLVFSVGARIVLLRIERRVV